MSEAAIFVVDELVAKPGQARTVLELYTNAYAQGARSRGMVLCHSWISPPLVIEGNQSNRLTFVWSVKGIAGWWKMRRGALSDPATSAFWVGLEPLIEERHRRFYGETGDV
jgi:hypothetical protein